MNQLRAHLQEGKDGLVARGNRQGQRPPRSKKAEARGHEWNEGFAAVN
jgi:hypothetical protein